MSNKVDGQGGGMAEQTWRVWTCAQVLRDGVRLADSGPDDWEPGCGTQCERIATGGRLSCPNHGDRITCNMREVKALPEGQSTEAQDAAALACAAGEQGTWADQNDAEVPEDVFESLAARGLVKTEPIAHGRDVIETVFITPEGTEYLERLVRGLPTPEGRAQLPAAVVVEDEHLEPNGEAWLF